MSYHESTIIRVIPQGEASEIYQEIKDISDLPSSFMTPRFLESGDCVLITAEGKGFVLVNFKPAYAPFARLKIPEIQGLSVHRGHRNQGIAKALVRAAEEYVRERGLAVIGLGVGLSSFYGPAQCLYVGLGYRPDGNGLVYDANPIPQGKAVMNDDDLCLMMIKEL